MFSRSTDLNRNSDPSAAKAATQPLASPFAQAPQAPGPATLVTAPAGQPGGSPVSVIGNDLTILGPGIPIISKGSLQRDGAIQGSLHGTEILVGEKGRVEGTIAAQSVIIRGTVKGTVRALRVSLQEGAHVDGEIHHQTLAIDAKGYQWRWELSRNEVAVGQAVEFRVTAADINHGFALYDPSMRLVAQTQAMPGYVNRLNYTFERAGTYKVLCLEYCGIAHHNMVAEIKVADR